MDEKFIAPLEKGWKREFSIRKQPSKLPGDVYYHPPTTDKRLRSPKEVLRYLAAHEFEPFCEGLKTDNFSFKRELISGGHENEYSHDAEQGLAEEYLLSKVTRTDKGFDISTLNEEGQQATTPVVGTIGPEGERAPIGDRHTDIDAQSDHPDDPIGAAN